MRSKVYFSKTITPEKVLELYHTKDSYIRTMGKSQQTNAISAIAAVLEEIINK